MGSLPWISDVCGAPCTPAPSGTNRVFEIDPATGQAVWSFAASAVPGLQRGPDSLALSPQTGHLYFASHIVEDRAGVTTQAGALVAAHPVSSIASAAAFSPAGELYIASDPADNGTGRLHRMNVTTGALETTILISGYTGTIKSMDFDPITGNVFVMTYPGRRMLEVDLSTGDVLSETIFPQPPVLTTPIAFAFDSSGTRIYMIEGLGSDADTLYVYHRGGIGNIFCTPTDNSTGGPGRIVAFGSPLVADGDLRLLAYDLPPGQFGYFLASRTFGTSMPPGSDGYLCLQSNVGRYSAPSQVIVGPTGMLAVDLTSIPVNPPMPVMSGQVWGFQCWHRDVGGANNFTQAAALLFL